MNPRGIDSNSLSSLKLVLDGALPPCLLLTESEATDGVTVVVVGVWVRANDNSGIRSPLVLDLVWYDLRVSITSGSLLPDVAMTRLSESKLTT